MLSKAAAVLVALALAFPGLAVAQDDSKQDEKKKGKKPALELRASPRFGFSPMNVLFTAELKGGDDVEEYYCPEVEWEWGDGGKSVQEGDCPPFEPGVSKIQRHFSIEKEYRRAGVFNVQVSLKRTNKTFAKSHVRVTVRPGLGDPTRERE